MKLYSIFCVSRTNLRTTHIQLHVYSEERTPFCLKERGDVAPRHGPSPYFVCKHRRFISTPCTHIGASTHWPHGSQNASFMLHFGAKSWHFLLCNTALHLLFMILYAPALLLFWCEVDTFVASQCICFDAMSSMQFSPRILLSTCSRLFYDFSYHTPSTRIRE